MPNVSSVHFLLKKASSHGISKQTTDRLLPGSYEATLTSVDQAPNYAENDAVQLHYTVNVGNKNIPYKEIFINDLSNPRTASFVEYLAQNNIVFDDWNSLVNIQERLTFAFHVKGGRKYLNIEKRELLRQEEGDLT